MSKYDQLHDLFFHSKPADLLIKIKEGKGEAYASVLSKQVDCTYSHCVRIIQQMHKLGLVKFKTEGRIKNVILSQYGHDVAVAIENLTRVFNRG